MSKLKILPMPSKPVIIDNPIGMTPEDIINTAVRQAMRERAKKKRKKAGNHK